MYIIYIGISLLLCKQMLHNCAITDNLQIMSANEEFKDEAKNMESVTERKKETVECQHLICWPLSQRTVHHHTAKR